MFADGRTTVSTFAVDRQLATLEVLEDLAREVRDLAREVRGLVLEDLLLAVLERQNMSYSSRPM